ncbi:CDP-4-dehydro-6-deoxy-D-gulose 4-reductase [Roseobacter sp. SK209-2-6]|nr:CDP-4-dehydro-6-deoxy-D-gulose 4-reductase [Roseobacter sp. SK209-2-6]
MEDDLERDPGGVAAMTRILLTGSTGFVGRAVTRELRRGGHELCHVIRQGSAARLPAAGTTERGQSPEQIIEVDDLFALPATWWAETAQGYDLVLHMAWYAEPGKYQTSLKNLQCIAGTMALAEGLQQAGVPRFVGLGTCLEYDLSGGRVTPDTPLDPQSPYAAAKAACAIALQAMLPPAGVSFLWARLFYLHGEGEDPRRLVAALHAHLAEGRALELSQGSQIRDFLDVDAAAALLVQDALSDRSGTTNICSGRGTSVRALAESIADRYGRRDLLLFGARPDNPDDPPCVIGQRSNTPLPA